MKGYLLDTHAFIWLSENDPNLPINLRQKIDSAEKVYLSIISLWEIAIKINIGKLSLKKSYQHIENELKLSDILLLPITFADTQRLCNLPLYHRDPFDRMLIVQAMEKELILVSKDTKFSAYPIEILWE
ncbi:type II toxin-antitoxin system VapC family toxin [Cyanobacterium aponinum UTEX 3222]|uniref:Type II toxin-antitoxin system VapC family toxin n=1 Tax=Cyanobacterium aponinum AL20115 TaxID=3090662 RepID=A0AAF1C5P7_9CHRO|nr:type II toxin-antitoxin system VapC family toxin [Cyanobacterium aponinum]WPF89366.1 type II toxin-antitoxin system VapC family toxin [Cyanobacterium aponinum AL20115]WRL38403.1 type II toxin-antitoxin system VapC family toxin [Cyanobacterium aponinum UTEX 3221]WRL41996.1 type II toxin-antitoxin system VapC family toxin [Cyanobacterium aponinum UTEX 3222]